MNLRYGNGLSVALLLSVAAPSSAASRPAAKTAPPEVQARALANYGNLPLSFEENRGQADSQVRFLSRGSGYAILLAPSEVVLNVRAPGKPGQPAKQLPIYIFSPIATVAGLSRVAARIPDSAEVISSQGVIGRFAGRLDVRAMLGSGWQPIDSRDVWFVISPYQGIQTQSSGSAMALVAYLAGPLHATMVADSNGVWAFRWHPPKGVHRLLIPGLAPIPAWN